MSEIKLTEKVKGNTLVKKNCLNQTCKAEFIFRLEAEKVNDILGNTKNISENTFQCKVCNAKYEFEVVPIKERTKYNGSVF